MKPSIYGASGGLHGIGRLIHVEPYSAIRVTWGLHESHVTDLPISRRRWIHMNRIKLTAGRVRDFSSNRGQAFLWDTEAPGLAVRATANGAQSYIFQGKMNGQAIRITIGGVDSWPLESVNDKSGQEVTRGARQEARRLKTLIGQGIDPREQKRERAAAHDARRVEANRHEMTVGEAWGAYLEARKTKWSARHLDNHVKLAKPGGEPRTRGRRTGKPALTMPGPIFPLLALKLSAMDAGAVGAKKNDSLQRDMLRPWFEAVRRIQHVKALAAAGLRMSHFTGCAGASAVCPNGWNAPRVSWRKSWGTSLPPWPTSTIGKGRLSSCGCGPRKSRHGFWNRPASSNPRNRPPACGWRSIDSC